MVLEYNKNSFQILSDVEILVVAQRVDDVEAEPVGMKVTKVETDSSYLLNIRGRKADIVVGETYNFMASHKTCGDVDEAEKLTVNLHDKIIFENGCCTF